ncbi:unnamed protein product [Arctogadus glacialis]
MDFWENIPSRKEQEAIVGRTRRAVSSRPELEDALPEWAVELLCPTVFWPESYMPVPPDFCDRPKPPRSYSQPLPPVPRYQPLPPVPSYQPLSPAPSYQPLSPAPSYQPLPPVPSYQPPPLRTIRVGVRGPALHLAFLLRGPALYLAFAGLLKVSAFATAGLQRGFRAAAGLLRD